MTPQFSSSDAALVAGWTWAVEQALAYVRRSDPVGDWFEALLPGRDGFCMRDVAHQSAGAQVLGLRGEVKNMLRRFAENIAESRDWCSYWEISSQNLPVKVDYESDADFWYNLPANFDLLACCWRQYLWTGDADYLNDPVFLNFYDRTVNEYVHRWDSDGDGLLEHLPHYGRRGIGSYEEAVGGIRTGGDLVAAQFAAYEAYAQIQALRGNPNLAAQYQQNSAALRAQYESGWWNAAEQNYFSILQFDQKFAPQANFGINTFALYFGLIRDSARVQRVMDDLLRQFPHTNVESQSYFPEVAYRYGYHQAAYTALLHLIDPALPRREYPEVSYSVLGALVNGLMGIHTDSASRTILTLSHLTETVGWARIEHLPVLDNEISVTHHDNTMSILGNERGPAFLWEARFAGNHTVLLVNGQPRPSAGVIGSDARAQASVAITVQPGEQVTVALPS